MPKPGLRKGRMKAPCLMPGFTFDPSISLGTLLNGMMVLVGFVIAFTRIGGRIDLLAQRLRSVEDVLHDIKDFDKRLTLAQRDISDLRRGQGFVTTGRDSIDGEYPRHGEKDRE